MDATKLLNELDRRLYTLEQTISNPNSVVPPGGDPEFASVTVGGVTLTSTLPSAPQNVVTATGASFDVVYINVDWDAPLVGASDIAEYEVEIAKKVAGVYQLGQIVRTAGTNFRYEPVEPDTTYGIRITPVNRLGALGTTAGWVDQVSGHDLTAPPAVSNVLAFRGATSVIVKFDGLTALQARDVANGEGLYEIEIDTALTFDTANYRVMRSSATIVAFNDVFSESTWYARVAAIDSSGNQGPWETSAGATAGGVIDSMVVAGLDAAKITFGVMSGDRITTNTLHVNKLLDASVMTARTIEIGSGGQFKIGNPTGGAGTSGIFINDLGIRLYKDGSPTVIFDALTGTGSFTGNINGSIITGGTLQTAASGKRIVIDAAAFTNRITFHSGIAAETAGGYVAGDSLTTRAVLFLRTGSVSGLGTAFISMSGRSTSGAPSAISLDAEQVSASGEFSVVGTTFLTVVQVSGEAYFGNSRVRIRPTVSEIAFRDAGGAWDTGLYKPVGVAVLRTENNFEAGVFAGRGVNGHNGFSGKTRTGTNNFSADWGGTLSHYIDVTNVKNFIIDHPQNPNSQYLVHTTLEGPENAVFYRGEGRLVDGRCWVKLPDYFEDLVAEEGRSVLVTPILNDEDIPTPDRVSKAKKKSAKGKAFRPFGVPYLATTRVVDGYFIVTEAGGFSGPDTEFFWEVKGIRKDVPKLLVEPAKNEIKVHGEGPYTYYSVR